MIFTGGLNSFTQHIFAFSEAAAFRDKAIACGVPANKIFLEEKATNTQENLELAWQLLREKCGSIQSVILIQNPNMLRRVYAKASKLFPEIDSVVTSHDISFSEAPHPHRSEEMLIHELVGDIQRISLYADRCFIEPQQIDPEVWQAYIRFKELGYTGNLAR